MEKCTNGSISPICLPMLYEEFLLKAAACFLSYGIASLLLLSCRLWPWGNQAFDPHLLLCGTGLQSLPPNGLTQRGCLKMLQLSLVPRKLDTTWLFHIVGHPTQNKNMLTCEQAIRNNCHFISRFQERVQA